VGFKLFDDAVVLEIVRNIESAALEDEVEWQRLQVALQQWRGTFAVKVNSLQHGNVRVAGGIVEL
jgi:hypothetical protein